MIKLIGNSKIWVAFPTFEHAIIKREFLTTHECFLNILYMNVHGHLGIDSFFYLIFLTTTKFCHGQKLFNVKMSL